MERRDLEIFLAVAEELHFGRAAERLSVSTARVSQTVARLERRIGGPLFARTSRRVELTPIGQRLYDDLRPAYQQLLDGIERATAAARGVHGVLTIGFFGAATGRFVLQAAEVFRRHHPGCEVQLRENQFSDGVTGLLRTGEIDMLILTLPVEEPELTNSKVLFREGRVVAVSARHPFARRASVPFEDLARASVLRSPPAVPDVWDASLAPRLTRDGRPAPRGPVFATTQEMLTLVGAGLGVYTLPEQVARFAARPDVVYVPIDGTPPFEWVLTWPTATETHLVRAFAEAVREFADAHGNRLPSGIVGPASA